MWLAFRQFIDVDVDVDVDVSIDVDDDVGDNWWKKLKKRCRKWKFEK